MIITCHEMIFFMSFDVDFAQVYSAKFYDKVIKVRNVVPNQICVVFELS